MFLFEIYYFKIMLKKWKVDLMLDVLLARCKWYLFREYFIYL